MTGTNQVDDRARAKRARTLSQIKRDNAVTNIKKVFELSKLVLESPSDLLKFRSLAQDIDSLWSQFNVENDSLLNACIDLDIVTEFDVECEPVVREWVASIRSVIGQTRDKSVVVSNIIDTLIVAGADAHNISSDRRNEDFRQTTPSTSPFSSQGTVPQSTNARCMRLPKIPLPSFDGTIHKWPAFRDSFTAFVGLDADVPDIEKFYFLLNCLQPGAIEVIKGITVSGETFSLAWSTLVQRFDKPRQLASSYVEKLLNAPMCDKESLSSLTSFLNIFDESSASLSALNIPDLSSYIIFILASRCLPLYCRKLFEAENDAEYPTISQLLTFVKARVQVLENAETIHGCVSKASVTPKPVVQRGNIHKASRISLVGVEVPQSKVSTKCHHCKGNHSIEKCFKFKKLPVKDRRDMTRKFRLCFMCFSDKHLVPQCTYSKLCSKCDSKHHVLLHLDTSSTEYVEVSTAVQDPGNAVASFTSAVTLHNVMLGTALVHIRGSSGSMHVVRALIDGGSQITALTSHCVDRLGLKIKRWTAAVTGLAGIAVPKIKGQVQCTMTPRYADSPQLQTTAWVLDHITNSMPTRPLPFAIKDHYSHLAMADPNFDKPGPVDMLIGADLYPQVMENGKVVVRKDCPAAFNTIFGWIIVGSVPVFEQCEPYCGLVSLSVSMEDTLQRFWQIEEPDPAPIEFSEQGQCELLFSSQMLRLDDGRFSVPLPFRGTGVPKEFEGSRQVAMKRFLNLERKLLTNQPLYDSYRRFMQEYLDLGHMSLASRPGLYHIPHHAVLKDPADISKVRVVFDASASCYSGVSLNDCLYTGAKLQLDIVDILLRFRSFKYVFTTDVCKMYRQILVNFEHRPYQHILWRSSPTEEVRDYELNTVTYGVNCAPFLALRIVQFISEHDCDKEMAVKKALQLQTYVDDIFMGADSLDELLHHKTALIDILKRSGFYLKKWLSNSEMVLDTIPTEDRLVESIAMDAIDDGIPKVLGLQWKPYDDCFSYTIKLEDKVTSTKRRVLSVIARLFDPLGFLSPIVFYAKHLMQRIWLSKVAWDDPLPIDIDEEWRNFLEELPRVSVIAIPRFCCTFPTLSCQLCGFCDASERGYAAVVYLRVTTASNGVQVFLLGAKSKLAPIKKLSIPRLELCGALLLARWLHRIYRVLSERLSIDGVYGWSDSSVALSWIINTQLQFKVFVSNRVHQIQSLIPNCIWKHVRTAFNPADCASRGLSPVALINMTLYWQGPKFLLRPIPDWNEDIPSLAPDKIPEVKLVSLPIHSPAPVVEWINRFSSYDKMLVVVAWVRRFLGLCRKRTFSTPYPSQIELDEALNVVVKSSQKYFLGHLRHELSLPRPLSKTWSHLRPFIDERGVIRVGGRLSNALIPEEQKHPILLSRLSHLSVLLVRHWHKLLCHAGPRVITVLVSRQFWIVALRRLIRQVTSKCVVCVRFSAKNPQPLMADLPPSRVQQCRAFSKVGIDYAGPLLIREHRLRKARQYKVYIAVFVCMTVKCVHLELVLDLSTDSFLAAFDRFVARRGLPSDVYSDCGTNFVGAARQLRTLVNHVDNQPRLIKTFRCSWHFNPPSAPHFGGIWEAAVKSAKSLLIRSIGTQVTTLEEFTTYLARVESVLNSRPLTPLSTDPSDLECLTPGHFLIGQPLCAIPTRDVIDVPLNRLSRWKLLHQCSQTFWRRWSSEYLNLLQIRNKWSVDSPRELCVNDMVVVKDNLAPPLQWKLGRVVKLMPGTDGVVRVARVNTPGGELVRPVVKLVPLIVDNDTSI
uniref:Integrase catalytic domain-containing protein n=1 Tax=Schizaphis graminum TaxID=13262 RepID=A0A2S2NBR8_SCHGA